MSDEDAAQPGLLPQFDHPESSVSVSSIIVNDSSDPFVATDELGNIIAWSDEAERTFGWKRSEIIGKPLTATIFKNTYGETEPESVDDFIDHVRPTRQGHMKLEAVNCDQTAAPVALSGMLFNMFGRSYFGAFIKTVSSRNLTDQMLRIRSKLLEYSSQGIMVTDEEGIIQEVNPFFTAVTGYSAKEVIGQNPRILQSGHHSTEFYAKLWAAVLKDGFWKGNLCNRRKSGEIFEEQVTILTVKNSEGEISNFIAIFDVVGEQDVGHLVHLANFDSLTGLPNRTLLSDRINQAILESERNKTNFALLFIDLNKFKPINDVFGHQAGDLVLQRVAERLSQTLRSEDTVARVGGDEFVVLLKKIDRPENAQSVIAKLVAAISAPVTVGEGQDVTVTPSVGYSLFPGDGRESEALIRSADQGMYRDKKRKAEC